MSRGYNAFVRGSRSSFSLPTNMVTTTTMMMMMMIISVMILPCSSLNRVEMTSLTPFDGFGDEELTRMEITCNFVANNLGFFRLRRNDEVVVDIGFHEVVGVFEVIYAAKDFGCILPRVAATRGELHCWKNNLDCRDVASYTCEISNAIESNSRFLKVKSFVKSLKNIDLPFEKKSKVSTFRCLAYVSPATHNSVTFRWIVRYKMPNTEPHMTDAKVSVPKIGQCCMPMQSLYRHKLTNKDDTGTTISCSAFGKTLSEEVNILGAKFSSVF
ncbi:uncharacterized protein LOC118766832 isoform X2 [Octopus sinensis]|uniref:Uncharacterized protein LOC118766832 isoform X2 n=1 Tax=Octopus sinensis TaxID=2607531 RepID=A0A7E6FG71_9MOLL|nr:uncharacterized protein LOC118766832 isoform X2 [Octopus sinensis]